MSSIEVKNTLFPVFLKLENFRVLIVGGGKVGLEKVTAIINNSPATKITLVATHVSEEIKSIQSNYNITIHQRSFKETDLNDIDLVIVAVNNRETSIEIKQLAQQKHILANVADTPDQCDFYLGSIVQKGNVKIAVSTNGKSPTLAKRIRETFEESFPNEINESLDNLTKVRGYLSGDFTEKVKQLNAITSVLSSNPKKLKETTISKKRIWTYSLSIPLLLILGYLLSHFLPPDILGGYAYQFTQSIDSSIFLYILAGFHCAND
jgi:siroheme synthase-like protein